MIRRSFFVTVFTVMVASKSFAIGTVHVYVDATLCQRITGFGAAAMYGAMHPVEDVAVIDSLYGPDSPVGLNILRMEISPNLIGNVTSPWDTPYDWHGYLPVVKEAKKWGAIIYGAPWSPPAKYKTNDSEKGTTDDGVTIGKLKREDYGAFFDWLTTFCTYMKNNGAAVDVVSIQNEPDWTPSYSGCYYTPEDLDTLVADYASRLDKEKFGLRLMSAEALGYTDNYYEPSLNDSNCRKYLDIIGGHIYGHAPLEYMIQPATLAVQYGIEAWMTEHTVDPRADTNGDSQSDTQVIDLPTWHEQLLFAEEVNEVMLAGGSAYIYWYMVSHNSFIGSGDSTIQAGNTYGRILDRGRMMGQFAKTITGSHRLYSHSNISTAVFESSAYLRGDSLIVMTIDTTKNAVNVEINLPYPVLKAERILSTEGEVAKTESLESTPGVKQVTYEVPARSFTTFIFKVDITDGITELTPTSAENEVDVYTLQGIRIRHKIPKIEALKGLPKGIYVVGHRKYRVSE